MQNARFKPCAEPLIFLTSVNTTENRYRSQAFAAAVFFVKSESVHGAINQKRNMKLASAVGFSAGLLSQKIADDVNELAKRLCDNSAEKPTVLRNFGVSTVGM